MDEASQRHESGLIVTFKALAKPVKWISRFKLLCLRPEHSIAALFACENQSDLKNLEHLYVIGKLQSMLEQLFTSLLVTDDSQVTVHIKNIVWELSDYRRCSLYFSTPTSRESLHVIIVKTLQFTTPFKDDIRQLADLKEQVS